jgi:hypothetical protein
VLPIYYLWIKADIDNYMSKDDAISDNQAVNPALRFEAGLDGGDP